MRPRHISSDMMFVGQNKAMLVHMKVYRMRSSARALLCDVYIYILLKVCGNMSITLKLLGFSPPPVEI